MRYRKDGATHEIECEITGGHFENASDTAGSDNDFVLMYLVQ